MGIIITIIVLLGMFLFAFSAFILASRKEELWEHIEFKDGDNNE